MKGSNTLSIGEQNAGKRLNVFDRFGFGDIGLNRDDFLTEAFVVEIGREPRKIQVLTGIDGVSFSECYAGRLELETDGLRVKIIGKDDLIRNKTASGRTKDRIDLEELRKLS